MDKSNSRPKSLGLPRRRSRSAFANRSGSIKVPERVVYKVSSTLGLPSNIQVHIRIRPLIPLELSKSKNKVIKQLSNTKILFGNDREFNFDEIYSEDSSQERIFNVSVKPILDEALLGYNCCLFAYGQTGSGKTYTMGTNFNKDNLPLSSAGLLPLSINYLFNIFKSDEEYQYIVRVSFLELYNEEIRDLLNIKIPSSAFTLREDRNGQVFITGISESIVLDSEDALNFLYIGAQNRRTACTNSNEFSSRSHAIFTMFIDKINRENNNKVSLKVNFIDLAGSERLNKTGVTGDRFKESVSINSGLLALSKVIMALSDRKNNTHVPYRENKLTRILKDSLNGTSITAMIACVSPSELNIEESINTLNYASFAKSIKLKPLKLSTDNMENIEILKNEIEKLKNEIEKYKKNYFYNENIKLKLVIKNLKNMLKNSSTSTNEKTGAPEYSNISIDDENNSQEECEIKDLLEEGSLEREYSLKVTECILLKNDNGVLKELVKALRERESQLIQRINEIENRCPSHDSGGNMQLVKSLIEEKEQFMTRESLNMGFVNNIIEGNVFKELELNIATEEGEEEHDEKKNLKDTITKKDKEIKELKGYLREEHNTKKGKVKIENNLNIIGDKIKKLKEFQTNLKQKLYDNELYKTKIVKQKNTEIGLIKKEALEKGKVVKNLEDLNWRNKQALEKHLVTINFLKEELRNKSLELKNMKSVNKREESTNNTRNKSFVFDNDKYTLKYTRKMTWNDQDKTFLHQMKTIIGSLEEELAKKYRLEKRINMLRKEKDNFIILIHKYEERFNTKIDNAIKTIKKIETDLAKGDSEINKEKITYLQKQKALKLKVEKLKQRQEKLEIIRDSTIQELTVNENELISQIIVHNEKIIELKNQFGGMKTIKVLGEDQKNNSSFDDDLYYSYSPEKKLRDSNNHNMSSIDFNHNQLHAHKESKIKEKIEAQLGELFMSKNTSQAHIESISMENINCSSIIPSLLNYEGKKETLPTWKSKAKPKLPCSINNTSVKRNNQIKVIQVNNTNNGKNGVKKFLNKSTECNQQNKKLK